MANTPCNCGLYAALAVIGGKWKPRFCIICHMRTVERVNERRMTALAPLDIR